MISGFDLVMYGTHRCSCGCGQILGRSTNGTDGKAIEKAACVGDLDNDEEGYEWRCFTQKCFGKVFAKYCTAEIDYNGQQALDMIYNSYPVAEEA